MIFNGGVRSTKYSKKKKKKKKKTNGFFGFGMHGGSEPDVFAHASTLALWLSQFPSTESWAVKKNVYTHIFFSGRKISE